MKEIYGVKLINRDYNVLKALENLSGHEATYMESRDGESDIGFSVYDHTVSELILNGFFDICPEIIFQLRDLVYLQVSEMFEELASPSYEEVYFVKKMRELL